MFKIKMVNDKGHIRMWSNKASNFSDVLDKVLDTIKDYGGTPAFILIEEKKEDFNSLYMY